MVERLQYFGWLPFCDCAHDPRDAKGSKMWAANHNTRPYSLPGHLRLHVSCFTLVSCTPVIRPSCDSPVMKRLGAEEFSQG